MKNSWIEEESLDYVKKYAATNDGGLSLLTYVTQLVGKEPDLAMHGGGNTSLKTTVKELTGEVVSALFVKASGKAMGTIDPAGFVCMNQTYLSKLRSCAALTDEVMADQFRTHMLLASSSLPSVETLMHSFLEHTCIIHTHPSAILCLTNRNNSEKAIAEAFGDSVSVVPYQNAGLALGKAVSDTYEKNKKVRGIIVAHHGLITFGTTPKEAYNATIDIVSKAQSYLTKITTATIRSAIMPTLETAWSRYAAIAPVLRGLLSPDSGNSDNPRHTTILSALITDDVLSILDSDKAMDIVCSAPLTPDYLVRTKAYPLFIENPDFNDMAKLTATITTAIETYTKKYAAYIEKYSSRTSGFTTEGIDFLPKVVMLPGLGAICVGTDEMMADSIRDITNQALVVKKMIAESGGTYRGLTEDHLFDMEFRGFQRVKVSPKSGQPLTGRVALVTGSAGAIGSGICEELLAQGCCVAVTDLAGDNLDSFVNSFASVYAGRVLGLALDVTDSDSIASAFTQTVKAFGGVDILVINAGLAHVSPLIEMNLEAFRKLERVNVDGTLLLLSEAGRLFKKQNMGGDIVLISTKNVFAPGAKFGAYSATKAASHQLCRIASLEFAEMHVRVNMVAPDAVFSHGAKKSGLWASVGPDRMKARGLDEKGLEEYYRQRNLLKAYITAEHVAKTVLFFVTHQTPTTGATIPVDGGLPDATPR